MTRHKPLLLLSTLFIIGICLGLPWMSDAWTDPVIEGRALWAIQAPKNESGIEDTYVESFKIAVAPDNTSYVCGFMRGGKIHFGDITVYTDLTIYSGYVLALYPNGTEKYVITLNATGDVFCYGLQVFPDGFYVSGSFTGNFTGEFADQFPDSELKNIPESNDNIETTRGFFVKYHANGTAFDYSLHVLGSIGDYTDVIALGGDGENNLYLVGNFNGTITLGDNWVLESPNSFSSAYYIKSFNRTYLDARVFGGVGSTEVFGIATNWNGYSCIIGRSSETVTIGNVTFNSPDPFQSIYFQQLNTNGTQVWFDRFLTNGSTPYGVAIDNERTCTFAAPFDNFLLRSDNERTEVPGTGSFLVKYSSKGNIVVFRTTRGDVNDDVNDLACNNQTGSCYTIGTYNNNITFEGVTYRNDGSDQYYVAKFDVDRNFLGLINGTGVSVGDTLFFENDNLWASGYFSPTLTLDSFELASIANRTIFVVRYT